MWSPIGAGRGGSGKVPKKKLTEPEIHAMIVREARYRLGCADLARKEQNHMKRVLTVMFATTLGLACAKGDTDKRCRNLANLHHLGGLRAEAQALAKPGEKVPVDTTLKDSLAESPSLMHWYDTHCK